VEVGVEPVEEDRVLERWVRESRPVSAGWAW
jgi:hypothetical protein